MGLDVLRGHIESPLNFLFGNTRDSLDLVGGLFLLFQLVFFGLEFLVELPPNNGPSDDLALGLPSEEGEGFVAQGDQKRPVPGHYLSAVAWVDFHLGEIADLSSHDHIFIIFLILRNLLNWL